MSKKTDVKAFHDGLHDIMDGAGTMKDTEIAEAFVAKGWRKRSKDVTDTNVGCKFCEDDYSLDNLVCYIPTDDGASIDPPVRYCPFCGTKLKGGEEAIKKAGEELDKAIYYSECGSTTGLRRVYSNKAEWLAVIVYLAKKGLQAERGGSGYIKNTAWGIMSGGNKDE